MKKQKVFEKKKVRNTFSNKKCTTFEKNGTCFTKSTFLEIEMLFVIFIVNMTHAKRMLG